MRRFPANPFAQPSAPSRGGVPPSRASPPAPLGWRGPPLGACQISFFLAPTWTGEGEGSGLFDAAPRLRFAPCPRPLPFPASGPTGARRPLAPFTYGICTRTEQGKKNTGQEQEQKQQNTPFPAVFYNHEHEPGPQEAAKLDLVCGVFFVGSCAGLTAHLRGKTGLASCGK